MKTPKWLLIAKNEYRSRTSKIRRIRPYFPYITLGLLAIYVAFIAPALVNFLIGDFSTFITSQAALATMQVTLFTIFIYFTMIPITETLREEQTGQVEIFLAAPIRPSDVLLGEFLGEMPFHAIFITVITGFFTATLNTLGLDIAQMAITIAIFAVTFFSALWIGTVIAALLRTKLGRTARGKDIGRALVMIIALPMVGLILWIYGGGLTEALSSSSTNNLVHTFLLLAPTSWGAEAITSFASYPGNLGAIGFETVARCGGLLVFFIAVLWLGAKAANRAYSLEPTAFIATTAKPEGAFYGTVRFLGGGGSFAALLVSVFKDYSRRLENLTNITYMVGVLVLVNILVVPRLSMPPEAPPISLIMVELTFPILAVMAVGGVTAGEKESLLIYRKAPSGVGRLVKARWLQGCLIVVPISAVVTGVAAFFSSRSDFILLLTSAGIMILITAANVGFALGLFLLNPPFSIKSVKLWINAMVAQLASVMLLIISLLIVGSLRPEPATGWLYFQLAHATLSWTSGVILLYLGERKLNTIE